MTLNKKFSRYGSKQLMAKFNNSKTTKEEFAVIEKILIKRGLIQVQLNNKRARAKKITMNIPEQYTVNQKVQLIVAKNHKRFGGQIMQGFIKKFYQFDNFKFSELFAEINIGNGNIVRKRLIDLELI